MTLPTQDPKTTWSEEQVRRFLKRARRGYQNIKLPYGYETGGHDRSSTAELIFPADLSGKTVLDIGSFNGYFCLEALKRGAKHAVGIEVSPVFARQAELIADCLGFKSEYRLADIERDVIEGQFDYVLCLNVLHHLKNPIGTLEKLIILTRERLILEVASTGTHDRGKMGISWLTAFFLRHAPVIIPLGRERMRSGQTFLFTRSAVEHLLLAHRKVFATARVFRSPYKGRFIAIAEKRRVKRLVVVGGPLPLVKMMLTDRLQAGELPRVADELGIEDPGAWKMFNALKLVGSTEVEIDRLLIYYDFLRPYLKSARTYERDDFLDVLECAEELTILTFWAPPEILYEQIRQIETSPEAKVGGRGLTKRSQRVPYSYSYKDPRRVEEYYRHWIAFCRNKPGRHIVVTFHPDLRLFSVSEWLALVAPETSAAATEGG